MSKIALAMIVKWDDEAEELERALQSVYKHVDGIFITGTWEPQKKIKKIVKKYNGVWSYFPWVKDFSKARNFNFSQIPKDYEWIFWMDVDDIVVGAETFRQAVDLAEKNNIKAVFARYLYQVEVDEKGNIKNILIEHLRERLIRNDGTYEWIAPIHETLIEKVPSGKTDFQGFTVVHLTDIREMEKSMYRNIEILEEEVLRNPTDPRPIYYLAKAYFDTRAPELLYEPIGEGLDSLAIELMKDYLRKSGWAEERAQCWEYLSMLHREKQEYEKAVYALLEALRENPKYNSIYIQLALCYVLLRDWEKAMHWVKLAGSVDIPKTTLVVNPRDYKSMILEALYHIYLNTGQLEKCQKVATDLAEILPNDVNKQRKVDIDDLVHKNNLAHWVVKLAHHLKRTGQIERLKAIIHSIPGEICNEPALVQMRNDFMPSREWGNDEVAIYCGPGWEQWSPKSVAKGIGGSEEAVINLSRELAKLGWKVTVFADPMEDEGVHDGVNWLPHYHCNWRDQFNVLISWRQIGLFDIPELNAKKTYLWNHDIQNPLTYTPERVEKIDKAMFLSKWHRTNVPQLDESKVMYTGNGINL